MRSDGRKVYNTLIQITLYALFLGFIGNLAIHAKPGVSKIVLIILFLTILIMATIYEFLKFLFNKAVSSINDKCDPEKGKDLFNKLLKRDFFKLFSRNKFAFNLVYNLSTNNPKEVLNIIRNEEKYFNSTMNNRLIKSSTMMFAYALLDNTTQLKKTYNNLMEIKNNKSLYKQASPQFNWKELEALYELYSSNYKKAVSLYKNTELFNMNNREKTQYYYYYGKALFLNNQYKESKEVLESCLKLSNKTAFTKMTNKLLNEINKK